MDVRVLKFVSALKASGVRVSLAECLEAFQAMEVLGVREREVFRIGIRATLVKDREGLAIFEALFPLFFGSGAMPLRMDVSEDLNEAEAHILAEALHRYTEALRQMLGRLIQGELLSQEELERLGRMVGLRHMDHLRYREWMAKRMMRALRFQEVREALDELAEILAEMGMDQQHAEMLARMMRANQDALEEQVRQFAGEQIAENISQREPDEGVEGLLNQPFSALTEQDMERLRREVQRLAAALRTRVALRQKRAKSGYLDAKATIRANLKHGNVPIQLKHKQRSLKPKLVVLCDISTSMRFCSELMLSLLYQMQDLISKTRTFAFIEHLEDISADFTGRDVNQAVAKVLERMPAGYYNTDLGNSLADFQHEYLDSIDSRTTLIIVGDGRNNYNNPRLDIFSLLSKRCRQTLWINPEAPALWGSGDSDMPVYAPKCDMVMQASTLAQLTAAVDRLMGG